MSTARNSGGIRKLAGKLQSFLNSGEGRKIFQRFQETGQNFLVTACRDDETIACYFLTTRGLFELKSPKGPKTDDLEYLKAYFLGNHQASKLSAREWLEAIASYGDDSIEEIVETCIRSASDAAEGKLIPLDALQAMLDKKRIN